MHKHFHNLILGVSVLPALLVMPAAAVNVDNWDDFVVSVKADVEEGQTRITTLDSDIVNYAMVAPKDGIINGAGHTIKNYSFSGTPELVGTMGVYEWQYTNDNGEPIKFYTSSSSLSATSHTELFADMEMQNSLGTVDYKNGNYFDLTGRGTITNYVVAADDEHFTNGVYRVEPSSATAKKAYYVVCLEDQTTGDKIYVSKYLTITEQGYTATEVLADATSATYYENYFDENKHSIKVKGFEAGEGDTYNVTTPDLMTLDNNGSALQKPHNEYVVDGQHIFVSTTANIDTASTVYMAADLSGSLSVNRTGEKPLFYVKDDSLFVGSNGSNVTINDIVMSDFVYKGSSSYGAALTLSWGGDLTVNNSVFKDNVNNDPVVGGAVSIIGGNLTLNNVSFQNNTGSSAGVGLTVGDKIVASGGVGNKVYTYVIGKAVVHGGDFTDNSTTDAGGAIYVTVKNKTSAASRGIEALDNELVLDGTLFKRNHSVDAAGAIGNFGKMTIQNGATFLGNYTAGDGGVMFLGAESSTMIADSQFGQDADTGNIAGGKGGVIRTRDASEANNVEAKLDILKGSKFVGNRAAQAGVLYNNFYDSVTNAGAVTIAGADFTSNVATSDGGAIFNSGLKDDNGNGSVGKINISNSTFNGNAAGQFGGAIYNAGDITLGGTNVFAGNTANGVANDIYNIGTLTVASGTTTMDGGITGDGTLSIADGATLDIGNASIAQSTINLGGTLIATLSGGATPVFTATEFNNVDDKGNLSLVFAKEGTYNIFADAKFNKAEEQVTSTIFDLDWSTNEGRTVIASKKSVEDIAADNEIAADTANMVSHIADAAAVEDASRQMKELAMVLQEKLAENTPEAKAVVEHATKAVHPETESVTRSVSSSVQNTVVSLASARMASPTVGRNGGDVQLTSGGVWAQGLFNKSKQDNAFNGYTRGIAIGSDGTINKHLTIGAGYSFAHSDISGTARDTEIDSNTIFVYGQYKPTQWYVNAIANYTMSDYAEHGTVIDNIVVTGDYSVDSFGAAVATGYEFKNGITPELGLRYMHVNANDYANSYGIKTAIDDSNFLTGIIGGRYAFNVVANKQLTFAPQLNAGLKYDLLSDKQTATVAMPGLAAYTLDGNRLNRIGGEFGIGLGMQYHNFEMSVNYDIDVREDYTSQTGMLKFRCNF